MVESDHGCGMPTGDVIAARDAVIPSAVGIDIGGSMIASETEVPIERSVNQEFRRAIQEKLKQQIPVGKSVSHAPACRSGRVESYLQTEHGKTADFVNSLDCR